MGGDGLTVPVTVDKMTLLAGLLAILAIAFVASGLVELLRRRRLRAGRLGGGALLLLIGLLVFAVAGWAQTYRQLTHNELVAYVRAVPVEGQSQAIRVTYTPVHAGKPGAPSTYTLKGDGWTLGGDVVKWQDFLNVLGVDTGYRTTRLEGYYVDANDESTRPHTAYSLAGGSDSVWRFLHAHSGLIPFVRATYGNDVRILADNTATYGVYVSTSGFWAEQQSS